MVLKFYSGSLVVGGGVIVALTLAEMKIPFEHVVVDMDAKEHKTPEHMAKHPFGQIPLIDDDGFIVYESRAICRYLIEKYSNQGPDLLPKGLKERALVEQAAAVEYATFHPALLPVLREGVIKPYHGQPVDQAVLDEALKELSAKLDVYEVILGEHKFLAGDEFTFADLCHYASAPMLTRGGIEIMTSKGPNVTRYVFRLHWRSFLDAP
ncbi:Glutathione S-transferase [Mycena sanguinolenta]|uniref:glutathione transferase n=1 Tax=Mycena sanguinolenta TaxID=230812 RepID=A0A8H7CQV4_9AGAR|nr:Glutathione S-transferase [Mycena sanguinolenta]